MAIPFYVQHRTKPWRRAEQVANKERYKMLTLSTLTSAVNFADAGQGVLAVAAGLAGLYVAIKGVKIILGFIRG